MGSEDKGIDEGLLNIVNEQIKIPLKGEIESLNVSAAAAVMIFEVVRQRDASRGTSRGTDLFGGKRKPL